MDYLVSEFYLSARPTFNGVSWENSLQAITTDLRTVFRLYYAMIMYTSETMLQYSRS